jgi:hypothetical protein
VTDLPCDNPRPAVGFRLESGVPQKIARCEYLMAGRAEAATRGMNQMEMVSHREMNEWSR